MWIIYKKRRAKVRRSKKYIHCFTFKTKGGAYVPWQYQDSNLILPMWIWYKLSHHYIFPTKRRKTQPHVGLPGRTYIYSNSSYFHLHPYNFISFTYTYIDIGFHLIQISYNNAQNTVNYIFYSRIWPNCVILPQWGTNEHLSSHSVKYHFQISKIIFGQF